MIENISFNNLTVGLNNISFEQICTLNQYALIETTKKFPGIAFYLIALGTTILIFNYYLNDKEYLLDKIALIPLIFGTIILFYFTFQLNEQQYKTIETIIEIICGIGIVTGIYIRRKQIMDWIKKYNEGD